jgi:hypothetical protein
MLLRWRLLIRKHQQIQHGRARRNIQKHRMVNKQSSPAMLAVRFLSAQATL